MYTCIRVYRRAKTCSPPIQTRLADATRVRVPLTFFEVMSRSMSKRKQQHQSAAPSLAALFASGFVSMATHLLYTQVHL